MAGKGGPRPNTGGKRVGAGRPPKELHERKRWLQQQAVLAWTSVEDAETFWRVQLARAQAGDPAAAKLVASYLFGVPTQSLEISGPSGKALQVHVVYDDPDPDDSFAEAPRRATAGDSGESAL